MATPTAPAYTVPQRKVVAVEHPLVINDLEKGLRTFGTNRPFERVLETDDPEECVPLYIRHSDPTSVPILSYSAPTTNVLLKITVPKRVGRKRKREAIDPSLFSHAGASASVLPESTDVAEPRAECVASHSRKDDPAGLLRTMRDNVDKVSIEAVAEIATTHRFRGLADFHHSTSRTDFLSRFRDTILTGDMDRIKRFQFDPSRGVKPNDQWMPPPRMSNHSIPFNYNWHQNPNIHQEVDPDTGEAMLVNKSTRPTTKIEYLSHDTTKIPQRSSEALPSDPGLRSLIKSLKEAFQERPVWTRRAISNRVSNSPHASLLRYAYQYVAYQFKNGAWREALVKYGVDPRSDPKYRNYQVVFFKFNECGEEAQTGVWKDPRTGVSVSEARKRKSPTSHLFDGKNISMDGKVWQICDITDPLVARLCQESPYAQNCDSNVDGWFPNGSFAKIKAIMRTKIIASTINKTVSEKDFVKCLAIPDIVPEKSSSRHVSIPIPDLQLTPAELESITRAGFLSAVSQGTIRKRRNKMNTRGKSQVKKGKQRYIHGLGDLVEGAQTPDNRALAAADELGRMGAFTPGSSFGAPGQMGAFEQPGTPASSSAVYGRADDDMDEDGPDEDDELEGESGDDDEDD